MLLTTTNNISGYENLEYIGLISSELVIGINIFKDIGASIRDIIGGRSEGYEEEISNAKEEIIKKLENKARNKGADAIIGIDFNFQCMGTKNAMILISVVGTAVKLEQ